MMLIKKSDKKGFVITVGMLVGALLIGTVVIVLSGASFSSLLSSMPAPVWIGIAIIIFFSMIGGKK